MEEQKYYFITVFREFDDFGPRGLRTWGFYTHLEDAINTLDKNITDLWETIYDYAVIEEYLEGISGYNFNRQFFKYDRDMNSYRPIEIPKEVGHYASFALG